MMRQGWNRLKWVTLALLGGCVLGLAGCSPETTYTIMRGMSAPPWLGLAACIFALTVGLVVIFFITKETIRAWRKGERGHAIASAAIGLVMLGVMGVMGYMIHVYFYGW